MPRVTGPTCSVCLRADVADLNRELLGGTSVAAVAREFKASEDAVRRHKKFKHFPPDAVDERIALRSAAMIEGKTPLEFALALRESNTAKRLLAESQGKDKDAQGWAREARLANQQVAELEGLIQSGNAVINVDMSTHTTNLALVQSAVIRALADEPSARAKVLLALERVEAEAEPS